MYGLKVSTLKVLSVVDNSKLSPVSTFFIVIVYPVISPLRFSDRGSSHVSRTDREDRISDDKFMGGPLGAEK